jgi:predicted Zn-dependent protease with MMP-like domain
LTREEFEDQVDLALDSLPDEIADLMDNIEVIVESRPSRRDLQRMRLPRGETLLGLYVGISLDRRGEHYANAMPDRVIIYQKTIEEAYPPDQVLEGIRTTVLHEVGHHFGLTDERLRELGY